MLYVDVAKDEGLLQLQGVARTLAALFRQAGLLCEEGRDFTAHLTVAKASAAAKRGRKRGRSSGIPKVCC